MDKAMPLDVKKLGEDRWKDLRDLRLESLAKEPTSFGSSVEEEEIFSEEEWRRRISNGLFALKDDKVVGMIACVRNSKIKASHIMNIFAVYVKEEYRGEGVGEKLLKAAIDEARETGSVAKLHLTVNSENKAAMRMYEKQGFEVVGKLNKEIKVDGIFYDELIMEKLL